MGCVRCGASVVQVLALHFGPKGGKSGPRVLHEVQAVRTLGGEFLYLIVEALESGELLAEGCICRLNRGVEGLPGVAGGLGPAAIGRRLGAGGP